MAKATRLYTKEIRVIEVVEHDHFDRGEVVELARLAHLPWQYFLS
jgi:hypothetical protein